MKALVILFSLGLAGIVHATTLPPASILFGADRYCAEVAQAAVVFFNQRIAGVSETDMNNVATMMQVNNPATGIILKAVVRHLYHGPHILRTRREVIAYTYRYCMDAPAPTAATSH
jgi:hypothetical protein